MVREMRQAPSHHTGVWQLAHGRRLVLDRPRFLAILNATPDSFFGASRVVDVERAADLALRWVRQGADGLDVGGESTRPGAAAVAPAEQIERIAPLIAALRRRLPSGVVITVDTTRAEVARAALDAGADGINDVSAGGDDPDMLPLAARSGAGLILMHRLRVPAADAFSDQYGREGRAAAPTYPGGVVAVVAEYLAARAQAAREAGVAPGAIVLDPGLGFGKTVPQNLALIAGTPALAALGYPVLSALSRKSFTGAASALPQGNRPEERLAGTLALSLAQARAGAAIFRVHDVEAHVRALGAWRTAVLAG